MSNQKRECGDCTLCCKLLAIKELDKPQYKWCDHCNPKAGCQIYPTRPESCQAFECLWLQGAIAESGQPNKIHAVFLTSKNNDSIHVFVDPNYPGARYEEPLKSLIENASRILPTIIVEREKRTAIYQGEKYAVEEWVEQMKEKAGEPKLLLIEEAKS